MAQTVVVTRDEVRALLVASSGPAIATCLAALAAPDTDLGAGILLDHHVDSAHLLATLRRRSQQAEAVGLTTIGLEDAATQLAATPHENVRLITIAARSGLPWCLLLLAPDEHAVVAAFVVTRQVRS
ncbi:hypothetical protein [Phycicoccus avicenniae]|uniref:hypothetical protein n=1 Tax=Phycicoccus avicenniae TaxID=2828860 RepID=UPI003D2D84BF